MIAEESLINNKYKCCGPMVWEHYSKLFNKFFENDENRKYVINVYESCYGDGKKDYDWELYATKNNCRIRIMFYDFDNKTTIKEIEDMIDSVWTGLNCNYIL